MSDRDNTVDDLRDRLPMVAYAESKLGGKPRRVSENEVRLVGASLGGFQINQSERVWYRHASGSGGDALDLVGWCEYGDKWDRKQGEMFKRAIRLADEYIRVNGVSEMIAHHGVRPDGPGRERAQAEYRYTDEAGKIIFVKERWESGSDPERDKTFIVRQPDGTSGLGEVSPVIYKLHTVRITIEQDHGQIVIVEGEKCADALIEHDVIATTSPFGAGDWDETYAESLRGATKVVLLPDNDVEGHRHMETVASSLVGIVGSVKIVNLQGLGDKGDIVDWLDAGNTIDDLTRIAAQTPEWTPQPEAPLLTSISVTDLMNKKFGDIRWSVRDLLPEGVALLAGRPKTGKSWLALQLAIAVSTGSTFLGEYETVQGDVLYAALEDSERRLQSRLGKMGFTNQSGRLHLMTQLPTMADGLVDRLRDWLRYYPEARMIIVDTYAKIKPSAKRGTDPYQVEYAALHELQQLALEHGITNLLVHHTRKAEAEYGLDGVHGSTGITGAADTIMILKASAQGSGTLFATGRDIMGTDESVKFNPETFHWEPMAHTFGPRMTQERLDIVNLLRTSGETLTPTEIAKHLGKKREAIQQLCGKLHKDDLMSKTDDGRYYVDAEGV